MQDFFHQQYQGKFQGHPIVGPHNPYYKSCINLCIFIGSCPKHWEKRWSTRQTCLANMRKPPHCSSHLKNQWSPWRFNSKRGSGHKSENRLFHSLLRIWTLLNVIWTIRVKNWSPPSMQQHCCHGEIYIYLPTIFSRVERQAPSHTHQNECQEIAISWVVPFPSSGKWIFQVVTGVHHFPVPGYV